MDAKHNFYHRWEKLLITLQNDTFPTSLIQASFTQDICLHTQRQVQVRIQRGLFQGWLFLRMSGSLALSWLWSKTLNRWSDGEVGLGVILDWYSPVRRVQSRVISFQFCHTTEWVAQTLEERKGLKQLFLWNTLTDWLNNRMFPIRLDIVNPLVQKPT